jgi:hypothetical protein
MPTIAQATTITGAAPETSNWNAWLNIMPPPPDDFHVTGHVTVPNPGVHALLVKRSPQGFNPAILLLDMYLIQSPGVWPDVISTATARYDETPAIGRYTSVEVFHDGNSIANVDVQIVS